MREASRFLKDVSVAGAQASVQEIARQMRDEGLGCLVIVDAERRPIGIVTDRDLALRAVAVGRRARQTPAESVMSRPLVTAAPTDAIEGVIERMREAGIRRVPVVRDERVVGIVSLDDLVVHLGRELDGLGDVVRRQFRDACGGSGPEALFEEIRDSLAPLGDPLARRGAKPRR